LLDTHAFLWFIYADPKLSRTAADIIGDPYNERLLSMASIWEISIKVQTGKLALPTPLDQFLRGQLFANRVQILPIEFNHAVGVHTLQYARLANGAEHRDPFDRLIVSQAIIETVPIISIEPVFEQYGVSRSW
jgi:PIN domain nuclease of toxin-antitoxin system